MVHQLISETIIGSCIKNTHNLRRSFFSSFNCKIIRSRYHPPVIPYKTFSNKKNLQQE